MSKQIRALVALLVGAIALGVAWARDWPLSHWEFSETSGTTSSEITISGLSKLTQYKVISVGFERTAGSASNYTLKCGNITAFTDTPGELAFSLAQQNVSTVTIHTFDPPAIIMSDAAGKVYCDANWDAGSDNAGNGYLDLQQAAP